MFLEIKLTAAKCTINWHIILLIWKKFI